MDLSQYINKEVPDAPYSYFSTHMDINKAKDIKITDVFVKMNVYFYVLQCLHDGKNQILPHCSLYTWNTFASPEDMDIPSINAYSDLIYLYGNKMQQFEYTYGINDMKIPFFNPTDIGLDWNTKKANVKTNTYFINEDNNAVDEMFHIYEYCTQDPYFMKLFNIVIDEYQKITQRIARKWNR